MTRWLVLAELVAALAVSTHHRRRARLATGTVPRAREGPRLAALRALMALALFGGVILHAVQPRWMAWAAVDLPPWIRWSGVALGAAAVVAADRVLRTLGPNVTETVFTKERHELVTGGPYRRVRHPLYATAVALFLGFGLALGSWFVLLAAGVAVVLLRLVVIPREEQALLARFGNAYRDYMGSTGRLLPRLGGDSAAGPA